MTVTALNFRGPQVLWDFGDGSPPPVRQRSGGRRPASPARPHDPCLQAAPATTPSPPATRTGPARRSSRPSSAIIGDQRPGEPGDRRDHPRQRQVLQGGPEELQEHPGAAEDEDARHRHRLRLLDRGRPALPVLQRNRLPGPDQDHLHPGDPRAARIRPRHAHHHHAADPPRERSGRLPDPALLRPALRERDRDPVAQGRRRHQGRRDGEIFLGEARWAAPITRSPSPTACFRSCATTPS